MSIVSANAKCSCEYEKERKKEEQEIRENGELINAPFRHYGFYDDDLEPNTCCFFCFHFSNPFDLLENEIFIIYLRINGMIIFNI